MKLLFDQNLSPRLAYLLSDLFPGSSHVSFVGLDKADDEAIWLFAREQQFVIVSKDADYSDLGLLRSFPPYVIWLRLGNCTTAQVESALRIHHSAILRFEQETDLGTLIIL